jgi:hypothetical protein
MDDKVDVGAVLGNEYRKMDEQTWSEIPFWIPTGSVSLDYAISGYRGLKGGIPHGKAVEIWGPESGGKSALLDHIIREFINLGVLCFLGTGSIPMRKGGCWKSGSTPREYSSWRNQETNSRRARPLRISFLRSFEVVSIKMAKLQHQNQMSSTTSLPYYIYTEQT